MSPLFYIVAFLFVLNVLTLSVMCFIPSCFSLSISANSTPHDGNATSSGSLVPNSASNVYRAFCFPNFVAGQPHNNRVRHNSNSASYVYQEGPSNFLAGDPHNIRVRRNLNNDGPIN